MEVENSEEYEDELTSLRELRGWKEFYLKIFLKYMVQVARVGACKRFCLPLNNRCIISKTKSSYFVVPWFVAEFHDHLYIWPINVVTLQVTASVPGSFLIIAHLFVFLLIPNFFAQISVFSVRPFVGL